MAFFSKNERGYSEASFRFMRQIIIRTSRYYCSPRMVNPENMPQTGSCFIFANHSNYYDPFLINDQMYSEPTAGVMTRYQFYNFFPRVFMGSIGVVPTSKYVPEPGVIRQVLGMIKQKRMIVIFPEGGRRWDGKPKPPIASTFKMYWRLNIPVHPLQIHGSYLGWPRWADYARRNSMELHWLPPLHPKDFETFEDFYQNCQQVMDFDEYHPPESTLPKSAKKPAAGIQRFLYRCPVTGERGAVQSSDGWQVSSKTSPDFNFKMDKDSRLVDAHGQRHSLIQQYDIIRNLPIWKNKAGYIIPDTKCTVWRETEDHRLAKIGKGRVSLTDEVLTFQAASHTVQLPLADIKYFSIEKNDKLMFSHQGATYLVDVGRESALQWQDYIKRIQGGESAERKS